MIRRLAGHMRSNLVAYVALFIALGGTSYAATSLPRGSVGTRQLQRGAVTPAKLAPGDFGGRISALVELQNNGQVLQSSVKGVRISDWTLYQGGYVVFPHRIPRNCFPMATPIQSFLSGAPGLPQVDAGEASLTSVRIVENGATQLTLALVCIN